MIALIFYHIMYEISLRWNPTPVICRCSVFPFFYFCYYRFRIISLSISMSDEEVVTTSPAEVAVPAEETQEGDPVEEAEEKAAE